MQNHCHCVHQDVQDNHRYHDHPLCSDFAAPQFTQLEHCNYALDIFDTIHTVIAELAISHTWCKTSGLAGVRETLSWQH